MENFKGDWLSSIFKFSCIVNILPFYGSLPKWMLLMKRLSSETELIWKDNKDAFVIAGKKFKDDQDIRILKQIAEYDEIEDKLEL